MPASLQNNTTCSFFVKSNSSRISADVGVITDIMHYLEYSPCTSLTDFSNKLPLVSAGSFCRSSINSFSNQKRRYQGMMLNAIERLEGRKRSL
jgi:hypothetical protein